MGFTQVNLDWVVSGKHTSLQRYGIYYNCKKLYAQVLMWQNFFFFVTDDQVKEDSSFAPD